MPNKRWTVCVDWIDGPVEDTCEFTVVADSAQSAKSKACSRWHATNRASSHSPKIQRVFVLTKKLAERLCS